MLITYYRLGKSPQNLEAPEGCTIVKLFEREDIALENNYIVSVNSEVVNTQKVLTDGDKLVVTKNEIKGGKQ